MTGDGEGEGRVERPHWAMSPRCELSGALARLTGTLLALARGGSGQAVLTAAVLTAAGVPAQAPPRGTSCRTRGPNPAGKGRVSRGRLWSGRAGVDPCPWEVSGREAVTLNAGDGADQQGEDHQGLHCDDGPSGHARASTPSQSCPPESGCSQCSIRHSDGQQRLPRPCRAGTPGVLSGVGSRWVDMPAAPGCHRNDRVRDGGSVA
jgi:hypothetical protein